MTGRGLTAHRRGAYNRLAEPRWGDPIDTTHSRRSGGRWNAPGAFGVLYLNDSLEMARAQVRHKLRGQPFGVEDLEPSRQHVLVPIEVEECRVRDCASEAGVFAVGLPASYPHDEHGTPVEHDRCQPIGAAARAAGLDGVACRSAAAGANRREELALFEEAVPRLVSAGEPVPFAEWYLEEVAEP